MKTRIIAMMTLVLMLVLPAALYAQETDPVAVVTALYEAVNAGDVEAAVALFADGAIMNVPVAPPNMPAKYTGKAEIRLWLESEVAQHTEYVLNETQIDEGTVTATISLSDDILQGLGIAPLEMTDEFTIQDGKITARTLVPTDESVAKMQAAVATLPETGGEPFPSYALVMAMGVLAIVGGLGLRLLRCRSHQQG